MVIFEIPVGYPCAPRCGCLMTSICSVVVPPLRQGFGVENSYGVVTTPHELPAVDDNDEPHTPKHNPDPQAQPPRSALSGKASASSTTPRSKGGVSFGDATVHEFEVEADEHAAKEKKKDKWDKTFFHEIRDLYDEPELARVSKPTKKKGGKDSGRKSSVTKVAGDVAKMSLETKKKVFASPPPSPPRSEEDEDEDTSTAGVATPRTSGKSDGSDGPQASSKLTSDALDALAKKTASDVDDDDDDDLAVYERELRKEVSALREKVRGVSLNAHGGGSLLPRNTHRLTSRMVPSSSSTGAPEDEKQHREREQRVGRDGASHPRGQSAGALGRRHDPDQRTARGETKQRRPRRRLRQRRRLTWSGIAPTSRSLSNNNCVGDKCDFFSTP